MITPDDRKNGMTFILQLEAAGAGLVTWVETLQGESADRWYDIYRRSDWGALRLQAAGVFQNRVSGTELQRVRKARAAGYSFTPRR